MQTIVGLESGFDLFAYQQEITMMQLNQLKSH